VTDVDREIAELKSRGVVFEDYPMEGTRSPSGAHQPAGGAKSAWFKDTEGNILALIQPGVMRARGRAGVAVDLKSCSKDLPLLQLLQDSVPTIARLVPRSIGK
jgi:hypothetical protein